MTTTQTNTFDSDTAMAVCGVPGRLTHRTVKAGQAAGLWCRQRWVSARRPMDDADPGGEQLHVEMRFDDQCDNGHNTFAITAEVNRPGARAADESGCLHGYIADIFPELAHLIPYHLVTSDGPLHYSDNTLYFAGDRDCNGLRAGERRPRTTRDGRAMWELVAVNAPGVRISDTPTGKPYHNAPTCPLFLLDTTATGDQPVVAPVLEWRASVQTGAGKARELDLARGAASWPEATDAQLSVEPEQLREVLAARLPALLAAFRATVEAVGFRWTPEGGL